MSNAMRFGKRSLAGLAAGALAFTGLAFVAAPSASAAQTVSFYCVGNGSGVDGNAGNALSGDPTTVQPNCTAIASQTAAVEIALSEFGAAAVAALTPGFGQATIDGPGFWAPLPAGTNGAITNGGKTLTLDATDWGQGVPAGAAALALVTVPSAGVSTVSLAVSTANTLNAVSSANTTPVGDLTVTGIGATAGLVISEAYKVIEAGAGATPVTLALVQVRDETGANVAINAGNVTLTAPTTAWAVSDVVADPTVGNDCNANGTIAGGAIQDPGNLANPIPACLALTSGTTGGAGVWVQVDNTPDQVGNFSLGVSVTVGTRSYTGSIPFTSSRVLAADWSLAFDKEAYVPGEMAELNICLKDLGGRPVPDGIPAATGAGVRDLAAGAFNAEVINVLTGTQTADASTLFVPFVAGPPAVHAVSTYGGCTTGLLTVPGTPMTLTASVDAGAAAPAEDWASSIAGTTRTASAVVRSSTPTPATIVIVGERGKGDSANMVFVEGTTTGLAGKTVTPHFRFPGQTGFTAGTGTRTVDAQGNFSWQRKTGKQIAVQFRGEGVVSNTVIIAAK